MNKTLIIAGGASVASLAAGAAGGYFYAKRKFDARVDGLIALEVQKTRKHFLDRLKKAEDDKNSLLRQLEAAAFPVAMEEKPLELECEDREVETPEEIERRQELKDNAGKALTDYRVFAPKPDLATVANGSAKKRMPPRDPANGKFVSPAVAVVNPSEAKASTAPYHITPEEFLLNDPEYAQESAFYFVNDKTVLLIAEQEEVDLGRVGEDNLAFFPPDEDPSVIYIRNDGLQTDYQITRTEQSLTVYMGLGEDDADLDDTDREHEDDRALYV